MTAAAIFVRNNWKLNKERNFASKSHNPIKFHENRSICWIIIAVFRFPRLLLDLLEMKLFEETSFCFTQATMPSNLMKVGPLVRKLLQILDFKDGDRRHLGFFRKWKVFYWDWLLLYSYPNHTKFHENWSIGSKVIADSRFPRCQRPPFWFWEIKTLRQGLDSALRRQYLSQVL